MIAFPSFEHRYNPYQFYSMMRSNHPVAYDDENSVWGVFRYEDAVKILRDHKAFSSDFRKWNTIKYSPYFDLASLSLNHLDPPRHTEIRKFLLSALDRHSMVKIRYRIEDTVKKCLNNVVEQGHMELVRDLAYPLPVSIVAELLGIHATDLYRFRKWADLLIKSSSGRVTQLFSADNLLQLQADMAPYLYKFIDIRRKSPSDDLISNLLEGSICEDKISELEIISFCSVFLIAGYITTVALIGNTVLSLLQNPNELDKVKAKPDLISSAVEESLRHRSPNQVLFRFATKDVNFREHRIISGQCICVWIGSANRDATVFRQPDIFDISRNSSAHIAFGAGIHVCLGAHLARLEAIIAVSAIISRLDDLRLDIMQQPRPLDSLIFHGLESLPLRFRPGIQTV